MSSTRAELAAYLQQAFFPNISNSDMAALLQYYPDDVAAGSPFGTGTANEIGPQYKRYAAIVGDIMFQAPRRLFLQHTARQQSTWFFRMSAYLFYCLVGS